MPSNRPSIEALLSTVRKSGLVEAERLQRAVTEFEQGREEGDDGVTLAEFFVGLNLLTKWQAEKRPSAIFASAGTSLRQRGPAIGQRGWKWQPLGGLSGEGISPAIGWKSFRPTPTRGTLSNRALV